MPTILVTGATGKQGSGVVHSLLAKPGFKVRALTRNKSSEAAQVLASKGAEVVEGSFEDQSSLEAAVAGCDGVFLVLIPFTGFKEEDQASAVIDAARAAGTVTHFIFSSVSNADWLDKATPAEADALLPPGVAHPMWRGYWEAKGSIERMVRTAGFQHWTITRPGLFMPAMLKGSHSLPFIRPVYDAAAGVARARLAFGPNSRIALADPADVGKFVAAAFADPETWNGRIADVAGENSTFKAAYQTIERVTGGEIVVEWLTDEKIDALRGENPMLDTYVFWSKKEGIADMDQVRRDGEKGGFLTTTFETFVKEHKDEFAELFEEE